MEYATKRSDASEMRNERRLPGLKNQGRASFGKPQPLRAPSHLCSLKTLYCKLDLVPRVPVDSFSLLGRFLVL